MERESFGALLFEIFPLSRQQCYMDIYMYTDGIQYILGVHILVYVQIYKISSHGPAVNCN